MRANPQSDSGTTEVLLEQYKVYIADLGNNGTRSTALDSLYFSLLGATVAVLSLTSGATPVLPFSAATVWIVAVYGWTICLLWVATIGYYRRLFSAIYKSIEELESQLPGKPYLNQGKRMGTGLYLSTIRQFIPWALAILILLLVLFGGGR